MNKRPYNYVVGAGGIGTGRFFELEGNHTLGRSESRLAKFTEYRDYCKLHIILHYAAVFLQGEIPVYAIGRVGADEEGKALKKEMEKAGINVLYVNEDINYPTMYSICCQYPDGEGFNVTANNSACQAVGVNDINRFFNEEGAEGHGLIIAAPEVPLETRIHLLRKGKEKHCFNAAAVPSSETRSFTEQGGIALTDLIALNIEEAHAFTSPDKEEDAADEQIIEDCGKYLQSINPEIAVLITQGARGASIRSRERFHKRGAMDVRVVNTAGAGDCFLGTVAAAMVKGVDLLPSDSGDKNSSAMDIGIAASGKKVTCKDTIDFSMSIKSLENFAREQGVFFPEEHQKFWRLA